MFNSRGTAPLIAMTAIFRIVPGGESEFETLFSAYMAHIGENEPGTQVYQVCRIRDQPGAYRILELFVGQEALDAHMNSNWLKEAAPRLRKLLAAAPEFEHLDVIA